MYLKQVWEYLKRRITFFVKTEFLFSTYNSQNVKAYSKPQNIIESHLTTDGREIVESVEHNSEQ